MNEISMNKIKSKNGDQFLADVEKASSFFVIKYSMIDNGAGGFLFVVE